MAFNGKGKSCIVFWTLAGGACLFDFLSQLGNIEQESNISKETMKQVGLLIIIKKVKIHQNADVWYLTTLSNQRGSIAVILWSQVVKLLQVPVRLLLLS